MSKLDATEERKKEREHKISKMKHRTHSDSTNTHNPIKIPAAHQPPVRANTKSKSMQNSNYQEFQNKLLKMPTVEEVDMSSSKASAREGSKKVDENSLKVLTTDEIKNRKPSLKRSSNWSHLNSKQSDLRNGRITEESFKSDSSWNDDMISRDRLLENQNAESLGMSPESNLRRSKTVRVGKNLQVIPMTSSEE